MGGSSPAGGPTAAAEQVRQTYLLAVTQKQWRVAAHKVSYFYAQGYELSEAGVR